MLGSVRSKSSGTRCVTVRMVQEILSHASQSGGVRRPRFAFSAKQPQVRHPHVTVEPRVTHTVCGRQSRSSCNRRRGHRDTRHIHCECWHRRVGSRRFLFCVVPEPRSFTLCAAADAPLSSRDTHRSTYRCGSHVNTALVFTVVSCSLAWLSPPLTLVCMHTCRHSLAKCGAQSSIHLVSAMDE